MNDDDTNGNDMNGNDMGGNGPSRDAVLAHVNRIVTSTAFRGATRSASLLRYLVQRSVDRPDERVKEYTVGVEALARDAGFDPRIDPIVRAEASRLRSRLERYYTNEGRADALVIELPKGAYVPQYRTVNATPADPGPAATAREVPLRRNTARRSRGIAIAVLAGAGVFAIGVWMGQHTSTATPGLPFDIRLDVTLDAQGSIASAVGTDFAVAPGGDRIAFVSMDSAGATRLRMQRLDTGDAAELPGTGGARGPFWSPDGRWIGFFAGNTLRKIAVDGGSPIIIATANDLLGASWGANGTIIAALDATHRLLRVPDSGGAPTVVVDFGAERTAPRWPQILPGGTHVLYTALDPSGADRSSIEVASIADGTRRVVVRGGTFGRFVAPNYLTFVNQGTLYALRFDAKRISTEGSQIPIASDVAYSATFGYAQLATSDAGVAVYQRASANGRFMAALVDSAGTRRSLVGEPGRYGWPALSPDGKRLALTVVDGGVSALSVFTDLGAHARVSWSAPGADAPVWTRDGTSLVARSRRGIVSIPATGGGERDLIASPHILVPSSFGPGDEVLAYAVMDSSTSFDVWTTTITRERHTLRAHDAAPSVRTRAFETHPAISPDGRWIAYASNALGSWQVYVRARADTGGGIRVSHDGGRVPRWSRNGQRLFFSTDSRHLMVAPYTVRGGRFVVGAVREWTQLLLADTGVLPNYNVSPDDRYIVALLPPERDDAQNNQVVLISNVAEQIRRALR